MRNPLNLHPNARLEAAAVPAGAAEAHGSSAALGGWELGRGSSGIWGSEGTGRGERWGGAPRWYLSNLSLQSCTQPEPPAAAEDCGTSRLPPAPANVPPAVPVAERGREAKGRKMPAVQQSKEKQRCARLPEIVLSRWGGSAGPWPETASKRPEEGTGAGTSP